MGGSGSSATTTIQSSTLRSLRRTLDELEDLRTMRNRTIIDARKAIAEDDARPAIMREANVLAGRKSSEGAFKLTLAEFEEVMERELEKFRVFKVAVAESAGRQADVLDRIKVSSPAPIIPIWILTMEEQTANESFLRARRSDPKLKSREKALQDLDTAYYKYSEISINLQEGLKFYTDFAKLLVELRDGCKQVRLSLSMEDTY
jgi:programmed cell death 6-interacting protein